MAEYNLDYFMDNPELKSRHLRAIPTLEMYRFFPPEEEIITIDITKKEVIIDIIEIDHIMAKSENLLIDIPWLEVHKIIII